MASTNKSRKNANLARMLVVWVLPITAGVVIGVIATFIMKYLTGRLHI